MQTQRTPREKLTEEINNFPEDLLPALLGMIKNFRQGIGLKSPQESLVLGLKELKQGKTRPMSELWDGIKTKSPKNERG